MFRSRRWGTVARSYRYGKSQPCLLNFLKKPLFVCLFVVCEVYVHAHVCQTYSCFTEHMWRLEVNLQESVLSLYCVSFRESNSGHQTWQKMPLPTGPCLTFISQHVQLISRKRGANVYSQAFFDHKTLFSKDHFYGINGSWSIKYYMTHVVFTHQRRRWWVKQIMEHSAYIKINR